MKEKPVKDSFMVIDEHVLNFKLCRFLEKKIELHRCGWARLVRDKF